LNQEKVKGLAKVSTMCFIVVGDILVAVLNRGHKITHLVNVDGCLAYTLSFSQNKTKCRLEFPALSQLAHLEDIEFISVTLQKFILCLVRDIQHLRDQLQCDTRPKRVDLLTSGCCHLSILLLNNFNTLTLFTETGLLRVLLVPTFNGVVVLNVVLRIDGVITKVD